MSLPSRERGLKSQPCRVKKSVNPVAPLAGAWIEIYLAYMVDQRVPVAPLAGAWIEIEKT